MKVQAKCTAKAWDSRGEIFGYPVLCSPGEVYEIPSDGELAKLTVVPVGYDNNGNAVRFFRDHSGEIKSAKVPKPDFVFEFDRNPIRTNEGELVEKDNSCKICGMQFKTLNALGTHSRVAHKNIETAAIEDEPVTDLPFACDQCDKTFKDQRALVGHVRWGHKKTSNPVETPAETASVQA